MILHIYLAGKELVSVPYRPEDRDRWQAYFDKWWRPLNELGRVSAWIDCGNVAKVIGGSI
jgi:hypothetical protein